MIDRPHYSQYGSTSKKKTEYLKDRFGLPETPETSLKLDKVWLWLIPPYAWILLVVFVSLPWTTAYVIPYTFLMVWLPWRIARKAKSGNDQFSDRKKVVSKPAVVIGTWISAILFYSGLDLLWKLLGPHT